MINKSQHQSIFNCRLSNLPIFEGKPLMDCQDFVNLARTTFYIDPVKNEMYDYLGPVPANIAFFDTTNNADKPEWSAKARVTDGWYFTTSDTRWVLNFQSDNGTVTTVKAGTFTTDGTVKVLFTYPTQ